MIVVQAVAALLVLVLLSVWLLLRFSFAISGACTVLASRLSI